MISKLKGIVLVVILSLASIMMPFNVYADTFEWYRVTGELMSSQLNNELTINNTKVYEYLFNYQYHVKFDDSYLGYAQISITQEYYDDTDNNGALSVNTLKSYTTPVKTYYVNSDEVVVNLSLKVRISTGHIQTNYDPCKNFTPSVTVSNANVTKIGLLTSIDEVIDILSDIYSSVDDIEGLSTNQLTELENIVSNSSLANQYLESIDKMRNWNIGYDQISLLTFFEYNDPVDFYQYGHNITIPIFSTKQADERYGRFYFRNGRTYKFIVFGFAFQNFNNYKNVFKFSSNDIQNVSYNYMYYDFSFRNYTYNLGIYEFKMNGANGYVDLLASQTQNYYFMPVGMFDVTAKNYSTDFALQFGLSNQLLEDLHIIANGTNQSNSAASNLEQETSEYSDIADDVIGVEEGLTSNFETEVNKIDLNTGLNVFGGNFMTSATWVRTQFDRLTENTPYGSLIVYGLTLGFALLMLGKVFL